MASVMDLIYEVVQINPDLLHEELAAALGADFIGVSLTRGQLRVHVVETIAQAQIDQIPAILAAHDPNGQTVDQQAQALAEQAQDDAAAIPGWAGWSEQEALDYIDTNVADLADAKVVLKAMARLLVALRNQTWPRLGIN